jgi:hypothetical protein
LDNFDGFWSKPLEEGSLEVLGAETRREVRSEAPGVFEAPGVLETPGILEAPGVLVEVA